MEAIFRGKVIDTEDKYVEGYKVGKYTILSLKDLKYYEIEPDTLSIRIGKRKMFMSLDIENGKGGDKVGEKRVLVWNEEMLNCSVLNTENGDKDYEISLDNSDFDNMTVIGIQS